MCKHTNAYYFHENAPKYCPDCHGYIDGDEVLYYDRNEEKDK